MAESNSRFVSAADIHLMDPVVQENWFEAYDVLRAESPIYYMPQLGMFVLTFVVWVYMYAKRIPFITQSGLGPDDFRSTRFAELQPPAVANPSDNLKNLFEMPVLFYAMCLYLHATNQVDGIYLGAAWLFLAFRVLHSIIHCTINVVIVRFWIYAAASAALWYMIFRAALNAITG